MCENIARVDQTIQDAVERMRADSEIHDVQIAYTGNSPTKRVIRIKVNLDTNLSGAQHVAVNERTHSYMEKWIRRNKEISLLFEKVWLEVHYGENIRFAGCHYKI